MKNIRRFLFALGVAVCMSAVALSISDTALDIPPRILVMVAASSAALAVVSGFLEVRSWQLPTPEDPPVARYVTPKSPVEKAMEAMDNAADVSTRTERKVRIRIDTEDARND
jgi:hypothetical protein